MSKAISDLKNKWEKRHVQHVLAYCNKTTDAHLKIKGRAEDVYPYLKDHINWDWVCYETKTGDEVAVEIKRITDPQKEQKYHIIYKTLTEVQNRINKLEILPGTYLLSSQIQFNKSLLLRKKVNKTEFKDTVFQVICELAKSMKQGEEKPLTPLIKQQLSFHLPDLISLTLCKISAEGSEIGKGFGIMGTWSIGLNDNELSEFQRLVSHANEQLGKSKPRKTILVIIEEGLRHTIPETIIGAFSKITPDCYSNISNVYLIRGKEVTEIPLPNSTLDPLASR